MAQWCGFGEEQQKVLAGVAVIPVCLTNVGGVTHARESNVGPPKRGEGLVFTRLLSLTCSHPNLYARPYVIPCISRAANFWPPGIAPHTCC
jgi:hypothetical protein